MCIVYKKGICFGFLGRILFVRFGFSERVGIEFLLILIEEFLVKGGKS